MAPQLVPKVPAPVTFLTFMVPECLVPTAKTSGLTLQKGLQKTIWAPSNLVLKDYSISVSSGIKYTTVAFTLSFVITAEAKDVCPSVRQSVWVVFGMFVLQDLNPNPEHGPGSHHGKILISFKLHWKSWGNSFFSKLWDFFLNLSRLRIVISSFDDYSHIWYKIGQ